MRLRSLLTAAMLASASPALAVDPTFTNIAGAVGLTWNGGSQGDQPVFRYRDSYALVQSHHGSPWPVFQFGARRFNPVASVLPAREDGHGCQAADLTNPDGNGLDGLVDLLCTKGACQGTCSRPYPKELWVQQPGGGFVNRISVTPMAQPRGRGRDIAIGEVGGPGDTRQVIAFANENSRDYPSESIDRAYLQAGGRFTELPLLNASGGGRANTAGFCAETLSRGPNMPDLLFCDDNRVNVYRWTGSSYRLTQPYGNFFARDVLATDIDGNGSQDILTIVANRVSVRLGGTSTVNLASLSQGFALARGDMNCDGRADILAVQNSQAGNAHALLLNSGSGLSYRRLSFPHPSNGSGDSATYVENWDRAGHSAMLVSHGHFTSGPAYFVQSSCTR